MLGFVPLRGGEGEVWTPEALAQTGANALLYFDIEKFGELEARFGVNRMEEVLGLLDAALIDLWEHRQFVTAAFRSFGDDYFVLVQVVGEGAEDIVRAARAIAEFVRDELVNAVTRIDPEVGAELRFHVGVVPLLHFSPENAARFLYSAVKRALTFAKVPRSEEARDLRAEIAAIVEEGKLRVLFQPIFRLDTGELLGFEALTRGPAGSPWESPLVLFAQAARVGLLHVLERRVREKAIEEIVPYLRRVGGGARLFLNVSPSVLLDPSFRPYTTRESLLRFGLSPEEVVFEVTEGQEVGSPELLREVTRYYREQGFRIALDDAGSGYNSLRRILDLRPDYIKIDRPLVADLDRDVVKQSLLEGIVQFATKAGSHLIAEGIETEDEFKQLVRLGVEHGQGFFLGRPQNPPSLRLPAEAEEILRRNRRAIDVKSLTKTVREIMQPASAVPPEMPVSQLKEYFDLLGEDVVFVVEGGEYLGVVQRARLDGLLSTQYGYSLYIRKQAGEIATRDALVLAPSVPVDTAARLLLEPGREGRLCDPIVVAEDRRPLGVVSLASLLDYLAHVKAEVLRLTNPLTGLPGNHLINRALADFLARGQPFSFAYIDLNRFKSFNDRFGFQRGDEVIRFLAEVLREVETVIPEAFVGHVGGDDFVALLPREFADRFVELVFARFRAERKLFLQGIAGRKAGTLGENLLTLSVVLVHCLDPLRGDPLMLSEAAALLKKRAKERPSDVYLEATASEIFSSQVPEGRAEER
ncbi:MAG: EAL domain-containing protein [Brockia lithotrophica]|nr:EAL domain-containing protein [Brockia lithotrophica]